MFNRIAIIGLGLIGGSIARAAHERKLATTLIGCDPSDIALEFARQHGFIDEIFTSPAQAAANSDLILLAAPPGALASIAEAIGPYIKPSALVMDICSVKEAAIAAIAPHLPAHADFIPAHPIAGSQHTGIAAGRADLFARKLVILTPEEPQETPALKAAMQFWQALGAKVECIPAALHDMIYAHVSHLPQLLAFAAAKPLADYKNEASLQNFLRLSHSSPSLWVDIFLTNKANVLAALDRYLDAISHIKTELAKAPEGSVSEGDTAFAHTTLFPRIAASCLITTVMEAEKNAGFSLRRYAGAGFADFTSPASAPPEDDIERISGQYAAVGGILGEYIDCLKTIRAALVADDRELNKAISVA